jgi:hypothetical protein
MPVRLRIHRSDFSTRLADKIENKCLSRIFKREQTTGQGWIRRNCLK